MDPKRKNLGPRFSEGARLLWLKIEKAGGSIATVRKRLGIPRDQMSRLLYGDRAATLGQANRCFEILGIPTATWEQAPKRSFVLPAVRRAEDNPAPQASAAL